MRWIPRKSLGPFVLGDSLAGAMAHANFVASPTPVDESLDMHSFVADGGRLRLEARAGRIESVSSEDAFMIEGRNIIGLRLEEVERILAASATEIEDVALDEGGPVIADFDALRLQLVIRDGAIVSATCY